MNNYQQSGAALDRPTDILTRTQAAEYLSISKGLLAQLHDLPKANVGRRVLYRRSDLLAFIERRGTS
jgi:excisionase family DNA binding protein